MGMNLNHCIVVDIECTCAEDKSIPNEPIEIGMVLYSFKRREVIDKESFFVKPEITPVLTDYCKSLTTITQDQVDAAKTLEEVYEDIFHRFPMIKQTVYWMSCGQFDRHVLTSQGVQSLRPGGAEDKNISPALNPFDIMQHLNLKSLFALQFKLKREIGLSSMLYDVGEKFEGTPHRAIDDAVNTAKLIKYIFN